MQLHNISCWELKEMFQEKAATSNESCIEPSIHNEYSITGAVGDHLSKHTTAQNKRAFWLFRSEPEVTTFQHFIGHFFSQSAEREEN